MLFTTESYNEKQINKITLENFVTYYIAPNSMIRLWTKEENGYKMITRANKSVCMNHQLLNGACWQSEYCNCEVLYIKDIVVDDFYSEAINIVIKASE